MAELSTGASRIVDYAATLDCIHCGLCLQTCPTYRLSGRESSSPRGRVHLMRAVAEERCEADAAYAEELDFCLLCRHCESVCPAGVRFGAMMEEARFARERILPRSLAARVARRLGLRLLLPSRTLQRLAADALRLLQRTGLARLIARVGPKLGLRFSSGLGDLPAVPPRRERALLASDDAHAGEERVQFLQGCVQPDLFPGANHGAVAALHGLGVLVDVPAVACCGSLHAHNGDRDGARRLARILLERFGHADTPLVVNSAGCGAHLKELDLLFEEHEPEHAAAASLARRVIDLSVFAEERLGERELSVDRSLSPVTWDDPCHLCHGQGVRNEPRAILGRLRGVEVVPLPHADACCGSAGIYSLLRPEDSRAVFEAKLEAFRSTGARTLVTANPGCQLQWKAGLMRAGLRDVRVLSLSELLAAAR